MLGERLMLELVKLLDGRPSPTARVQSSASTARAIGGVPWHFRTAWLRLKQTDLIPGKGQFR